MKSKKLMIVACAMVLVACVGIGGCRYSAISHPRYEKERVKFLSEYKTKYTQIQNDKKYGLGNGYRERINDLFSLSKGTYNKVLSWRENWATTTRERSNVAEVKRYCDKWIKLVNAEFAKETYPGSDWGYDLEFEETIFYNKSVFRLLMSDADLCRWHRVRNMTWDFYGKTIAFSDGYTSIFGTGPYRADAGYRLFNNKASLFIDEASLFSANGLDYALVWLTADSDGRMIGATRQTEAVFFVEIRNGKVIRQICLYILDAVISISDDSKIVVVKSDGELWGDGTEYIIDLSTMKIIGKKESD